MHTRHLPSIHGRVGSKTDKLQNDAAFLAFGRLLDPRAVHGIISRAKKDVRPPEAKGILLARELDGL